MKDSILSIDKQLCFRLYAVSREMTKAYEPWLKKFNLTYPQYIVMLVLFEHKRIDFSELSKTVQLKTGTLTPIVNKLKEIISKVIRKR
jgi:DNA-binding MarR family transcriptional regulator